MKKDFLFRLRIRSLRVPALILLVIVVATIVFTRNERDPEYCLFRQNVEALTRGEGTVTLSCNTSSPNIVCCAFCTNCGTLWTVDGVSGQYVNASSRCVCGHLM